MDVTRTCATATEQNGGHQFVFRHLFSQINSGSDGQFSVTMKHVACNSSFID